MVRRPRPRPKAQNRSREGKKMTKTIIEQAIDNCNSRVKEFDDFPIPEEFIKEALRLFDERFTDELCKFEFDKNKDIFQQIIQMKIRFNEREDIK